MKTRWTRHEHGFGWICECGYHGRTQAGRDVHERRASRGLGCKTEKINQLDLGGLDCSELSDFDKQSLRKINENLPSRDRLTGLGD